jgi:hypothetical protein
MLTDYSRLSKGVQNGREVVRQVGRLKIEQCRLDNEVFVVYVHENSTPEFARSVFNIPPERRVLPKIVRYQY